MKKDIFKILLISVLYFLGGKLSFYLSSENSIVTISIFFAEGIALASVLILGKKALMGIFLGQLILALSSDLSISASIFISIINTAEAFLALKVLKYFDFDIQFKKIKDLYTLFFVIMFILQPFSALFGNFVLLSSSIIDTSHFFQSFFSWWFGNVMGQFLVTPLILFIYANYKKVKFFKLFIYGLFFATLNYLLIDVLLIENLALLLSILVPLVMLLGRYEGLCYTLFAILMIALTSLYTTAMHVGIFADGTPIDNLININFYILAHILISLINGILFIEKEEAQKELVTLNQNLASIVKEEIDKNRQKEDFMLQQSRLAQMGEMLSMIAHQWRQPLNNLSVINQTLFLKYKRGKLDDNAMTNFKKDSDNQIQQMSTTIDDFRNFFKPDKEAKSISVSNILNNILDLTQPMLVKFNIKIYTDIKKDVFIDAHQNEFGQVILNIINNAKDALVENNIKNKEIHIKLQETNEQVTISIEDNAGGIPEEILKKIFDPYFSTKSKNGTGLGLYMSKLIIEDHMRGKLEASNTNNGAIFHITLTKREVE